MSGTHFTVQINLRWYGDEHCDLNTVKNNAKKLIYF